MKHPWLLPLLLIIFFAAECSVRSVIQTEHPARDDLSTSSLLPTQTVLVEPTPNTLAKPTPKLVKQAKTMSNGFQAGVTLLVYGNDPKFNILAEKRLDTLVDDNVNSISLVFPITQDKWNSSSVRKYDATLTDGNISSFIRLAHDRGIAVLIRPLLDESSITKDDSDQWRGTIKPKDLDAWFGSYTDTMVGFAKIAEAGRAEIFSIGFELNSLTGCQNRPYWLSLISQIRAVYSGKLIYSNNWDYVQDTCFWDLLDFVGVDAFYKLEVPTHPTEQQLVDAWTYAIDNIKKAGEKYGKPVIATEIGVRSEEKASQRPWIWDNGTPVDLESQSKFYSATCSVVRGVVTGLYFWATGLYDTDHPETDKSFEFIGKPAEKALTACYGSAP